MLVYLYIIILWVQVTEGQPRVVLLLDRPAASRASIRVTAERAGQLVPVEEVKLKNPHTVMVTLPVCLMAKSCLGEREIDGTRH